MSKRITIIDRLMNEVTLYGGLPMRRCDVLRLATEHMGEHAKEPFGAQYFAMHGQTVEMEPWDLDEARQVMK